jgi:hypothetical protein
MSVVWSLGQEDLYQGTRCGIANDGEIDKHLVGVAFVMKFLGNVSEENRLCLLLR